MIEKREVDMQFIYLVIGLLLGGLIIWLMLRPNKANQKTLFAENISLREELTTKREQLVQLSSALAVSQNNLANLELKLSEQTANFNLMQEQAKLHFENLANRIFEEKSSKFAEQSQQNLVGLLNPLSEKIKIFENRVEEIYGIDIRERATLKEQISSLTQLNQQMSKDAQNLTLALKGDTKTQGNWGEMILESILEKSGLVNGREYILQNSITSADGKRYQPDVIINLPENKVLVIDAKVSLTAYERYISASNTEEKNVAYKEHVQSLRNHIKGLSAKDYQKLYAEKTLDFILLFIPIESAFAAAMQAENNLFDEALTKNIVIVCPSTLLATMRTVVGIWRSEKAANNALEIALLGGELYDRLSRFLLSMEQIQNSLKTLQDKYDDAATKLTGKQGVVKSALKLKELGAKTSKVIDNKWAEDE